MSFLLSLKREGWSITVAKKGCVIALAAARRQTVEIFRGLWPFVYRAPVQLQSTAPRKLITATTSFGRIIMAL
jgi:hypothetical protein